VNRTRPLSIRFLPLGPLAACVASTIGIANASPGDRIAQPQGSIVVTSCADSGAGSLRAAVQDDTAGKPIDLSQLSCSQITLTSGAIHATQNLTLLGPGSGLLTIDGNNTDRIFTEDTAGATVAISGITLQNGHAANISGGCIYSMGPVVLDDAVVTGCSVEGQGPAGIVYYVGGGLYVKGDFTATSSRIVGNEVYAATVSAYGGGVFVVGGIASIVNSTISGNSAHSRDAFAGGGGGWFRGALYMQYSTVSGNLLEGHGGSLGGGLTVYPNGATISNSTISGNVSFAAGGAFVSGLLLSNSTVAFNVADGGAAGLYFVGNSDFESAIVAMNLTDGKSTSNISEGPFVQVFSGANNLIGQSNFVTFPPGTIQSDPLLGPLEDNGGPTLTHALLPGSPAIDTGNNAALLNWDQRGAGFARVIGTAPDIGAVESPPADQPPLAAGDNYTIAENATLTVAAPGVLGNDSDPDGDSLTVSLVDSPSNGVLTLNPDGSFVYVPAADFFGTDGFTYEASDGQLNSQTAAVVIEVKNSSTEDLIFMDGFDS
jgi:Big-like domain-containing protein